MFPKAEEEQRRLKLKSFTATGFPGAIGAIDCTHVKIKKPPQNVQHCYVNRKGLSKNVQLICDYDLRILGVLARFAGGSHDAYIWEASKANAFLQNQYSQGMRETCLVGDSGYPLQPCLMNPFRNPASESEQKCNDCHSKTRNCVERLNGVLKKVFACLSQDRGLLVDPGFAGAIINACCTLHNFRRKYNLPLPEFNYEENEPVPNENEQSVEITTEGRSIRHSLVRNYFQT